MKNALCRTCGSVLHPIHQPANSPLNAEQWAGQRAGDFLCPMCPDNGRGVGAGHYLWEREVAWADDLREALATRLEDLVTDPSVPLGADACEWPDRVRRNLPIPRNRITMDALAGCCHDLGILHTSSDMKGLILG